MKILLGIWHPAHVHNFKNIIWALEKRGHDVKIITMEKDITTYLLDSYNFNYKYIGKSHSNIFYKIIDLLNIEYRLLQISLKYKPNIFVGRGSVAMAHISKLLKIPYLAFIDSEPAWITAPLEFPFIDVIVTPHAYKRKLNFKKHIRIHSFKELSYLHPTYFIPDPAVLNEIGLKPNDKFSLVRFVGWTAYHDVGEHGLNMDEKRVLMSKLEKFGNVYISSENELPNDLKKYELNISKNKIHSLLYYAQLFMGDSQTMTTEAAVLGTPAIRCNSFVGENDMSNFIELEQKYGLIFNFRDPDKAINKAVELIQKPNLKEEWQKKREQLLKDKIDVTAFMVWFIENYPESFREMKENPEIQYRFK